MKLVGLLNTVEEDNVELSTWSTELERQASITVAFQSLKECGIYIEGLVVNQSDELMQFDVKFFTNKPFPHTLIYEPGLSLYADLPLDD